MTKNNIDLFSTLRKDDALRPDFVSLVMSLVEHYYFAGICSSPFVLPLPNHKQTN